MALFDQASYNVFIYFLKGLGYFTLVLQINKMFEYNETHLRW